MYMQQKSQKSHAGIAEVLYSCDATTQLASQQHITHAHVQQICYARLPNIYTESWPTSTTPP